MEVPVQAKLKVCGMKYPSNIAELAQLKFDYMGLIFYPKSPRYVTEVSADLLAAVPKQAKLTGVFVDEDMELISSRIAEYSLEALQLHGQESAAYCQELRNFGVEVIKAFGIGESFDFDVLKAYQHSVDYFLFDTQTQAHGGSGKKFDWNLLADYTLAIPYFLSGGIDLADVDRLRSITDSRLYALDVNSKFEIEPGLKDVEKLKNFNKLYYKIP